MTKNELKDLVRSVIREELEKVNSALLTEASDKPNRLAPRPVKIGSPVDLAAKLYNSDEFAIAFADDGFTLGDNVEILIKDTVAKHYSKDELARAADSVRARLRYLVKEQDLDSAEYDDGADAYAQRYFKDANNF